MHSKIVYINDNCDKRYFEKDMIEDYKQLMRDSDSFECKSGCKMLWKEDFVNYVIITFRIDIKYYTFK